MIESFCTTTTTKKPIGANITVATQIIKQLVVRAPRVQVLICFCLDHSIRALLQAVNDLNYTRRFIILGRSDRDSFSFVFRFFPVSTLIF